VAGVVVWILVRLFRNNGPSRQTWVDESKIMQEIYHGLRKMEERVESLETLLLEQEKKGGPR
jgi:phage shock protein B